MYIIRGLPGSGKSTLSGQIVKAYTEQGKRAIICSADDYFIDQRTGNYNWDGNRLDEAHNWCRNKAEKNMKKETRDIKCSTLSKFGNFCVIRPDL